MIQVPIIVTEGCPICDKAKASLKQANIILGDILIVRELRLDGPTETEAVDLAIDYDLDQVPSFVIGDTVFEMDEFTVKDIVNAARNQKSPSYRGPKQRQ